MIGIPKDGKIINNASCDLEEVSLINEQPRKQLYQSGSINGMEVTVVESSHCETYKTPYVMWGAGTAVGVISGALCAIPLWAVGLNQIAAGVGAGVTGCSSVMALFASVEIAHQIDADRALNAARREGQIHN